MTLKRSLVAVKYGYMTSGGCAVNHMTEIQSQGCGKWSIVMAG